MKIPLGLVACVLLCSAAPNATAQDDVVGRFSKLSATADPALVKATVPLTEEHKTGKKILTKSEVLVRREAKRGLTGAMEWVAGQIAVSDADKRQGITSARGVIGSDGTKYIEYYKTQEEEVDEVTSTKVGEGLVSATFAAKPTVQIKQGTNQQGVFGELSLNATGTFEIDRVEPNSEKDKLRERAQQEMDRVVEQLNATDTKPIILSTEDLRTATGSKIALEFKFKFFSEAGVLRVSIAATQKITGGITDLNALFGPPHSSRLSTIEFPPQEKVRLSLTPRLTGHWTDKDDRNYSLIQPDWSADTSNKQSDIHRGADRATLKLYTSEGGQFSGDCKIVVENTPPEIKPQRVKIVESSVELEYQLQEGTVERRFPDWLKEMIVKQEVLGRMRLKGTLSPDGKTISANYVDYDIEADPDTRTITKRKERLTPLVLTFQHPPCGPNEILAERERESKELGEFQSRLEKVQLSWEEQSLQASIISLSSVFETDFDAINKARKLYNEDLQTWRKMEIDVVDKELPKNWSPYYGRRYSLLMTAYQKLEAVIEKSEPWRKKLAPLIIKFGDLITDRLKDANAWRLSKRSTYYCITQDRILGPEAEKEYKKRYRSLFPVSDGVQYQAQYELIVPPKPQLSPEDIPQGHTARPPIRHDLMSDEEIRDLERDIESAEKAQEAMLFYVEHTELFGVIAIKLNELLKKH